MTSKSCGDRGWIVCQELETAKAYHLSSRVVSRHVQVSSIPLPSPPFGIHSFTGYTTYLSWTGHAAVAVAVAVAVVAVVAQHQQDVPHQESVQFLKSVACRRVFTNQLEQIVEIVGTGIGRVNTTHRQQHDRAVQNAQLAALRHEEEVHVRERICAETWHDGRVDCITGNGVMSELGVGDDVFDHDSEEELHIVSAVSRGDVIGSDASDHQ
ncbi:uncharacterized protein C8Q71DRAFT_720355 [Rhodofomes roseus]|uniref:Uncharacterized protein n=1 Tax=Rhodofomes roseus TaxID=34475 RepID=A0ABQ8KVA1_9APHY|nr:uncharacterized protein C8Q71DRAFT_720355 [Rhodofomes roseus]KAH9842961.1 hypothetical protein C8Q71DRAFT_720355 [Rhodofomes roseus]